ncbi:hypothetical protein BDV93DRAFT_605672 [Ceratobasidium sp. AG-I]|nr:hypothetical protein BDV93DRAFT_605672 [Ceratobasidium sp. AG-I]
MRATALCLCAVLSQSFVAAQRPSTTLTLTDPTPTSPLGGTFTDTMLVSGGPDSNTGTPSDLTDFTLTTEPASELPSLTATTTERIVTSTSLTTRTAVTAPSPSRTATSIPTSNGPPSSAGQTAPSATTTSVNSAASLGEVFSTWSGLLAGGIAGLLGAWVLG